MYSSAYEKGEEWVEKLCPRRKNKTFSDNQNNARLQNNCGLLLSKIKILSIEFLLLLKNGNQNFFCAVCGHPRRRKPL